MRVFASLVACAGVALTVAGCDPNDKIYFKQGVGTDLYSLDRVSTLEVQDAYFARICQQAGPECGTIPSGTWNAFVRAGMNDIDERCDGYLTWLDNVRRSQGPYGKQITDTATATSLIMTATGASLGSMAVVAAAFGLASNSFNNLESRLLLEVPHSTVQAVVLSRQKDYRESLFGTATRRGVDIPDRPSAIYALRSYLRLCMPITIEMEINNTVATFERGGAAALQGSKDKFISATTVGPARITNVNAPIRRVIGTARPGEPTDPVIIADIRKALCLSASGGLDETAHKRLGIFLKSINQPPSEQFLRREMILLNRLIRKNQTANCSLFS